VKIVIVEMEMGEDKNFIALREFKKEREKSLYVPLTIGGLVRFLNEDSDGNISIMSGRVMNHSSTHTPARIITEDGERYFIEPSHYFAIPEPEFDSGLTLTEALNVTE
jgi:hypothetical protein